MSAQYVFDTAPLGAMIRFSDGTPRPPDRFPRKLTDWNDRNDAGRLIQKCPAGRSGSYEFPASFMLHMANYGSNGTIALVVNRHFNVTSALRFEIAEVPRPGMVRVVSLSCGADELRHLAPDMTAARAWLADHHYSDARCEIVGAPIERGEAA